MDTLGQSLVVGLAAFYVVAAWLTSTLPGPVRRFRARAEAWAEAGRWYGELLTCPVCLSFWAAALAAVALSVGFVWPVTVVAAAGVATAVFKLGAGRE